MSFLYSLCYEKVYFDLSLPPPFTLLAYPTVALSSGSPRQRMAHLIFLSDQKRQNMTSELKHLLTVFKSNPKKSHFFQMYIVSKINNFYHFSKLSAVCLHLLISVNCLHFQLFVYIFSFSDLFTFSAVCLYF